MELSRIAAVPEGATRAVLTEGEPRAAASAAGGTLRVSGAVASPGTALSLGGLRGSPSSRPVPHGRPDRAVLRPVARERGAPHRGSGPDAKARAAGRSSGQGERSPR